MDHIFDRLGRLINSFFLDGGDDDDSPYSGKTYRQSGDSDFDSAMDELNDFLRPDLTEAERREREEARRAAEEAARSRSSSSGGPSPRRPSGPPAGLVKDYALFGLPVGTKLEDIKPIYKKILKENHPDRHAGHAGNMKLATEYSAKVNAAYQRIEAWLQTGRYGES